MKLVSFQVRDFRSVTDSGSIRVEAGRTVLVGRNESGKSSLLRALHSLNPPGGKLRAWGLARDFPRTRKRSEFRDDLVMLETAWELTAYEQAHLARIFPRSQGAKQIEISRTYAPKRLVGVPTAQALSDVAAPAVQVLGALSAELAKVCSGVAGAEPVTSGLTALGQELGKPADDVGWGTAVAAALVPLRAAIAAIPELAKAGAQHLATIEARAKAVAEDDTKRLAAVAWIEQQIPTFVYLDDWDFVPGHHNIKEYLERLPDPAKRKLEDPLFEKLMKVAELNPQELQGLLTTQHEERTLLTDRAGNVITTTLESLWRDREITVQFRIDADHFDVIVKDKDSNALVPLDERSRGFRWYFSFFVSFAADTQGGAMEKAILLLDEPGLYLHALAQEALLAFFRSLPNQIVYSTHSPFMVEPSELTAVRTVNLTRTAGTTASADPTGDANTLFPLQAALGYNLTQTMFVGTDNVVVEGVTDYWYLTAASGFLEDAGLRSDLVLTPAGGAGKVGYMVALLTAQRLKVAVLLDSDGAGNDAAKDLLKTKLIGDSAIVRVGSVLASGTEADIEDLLEPEVFEALARETYKKELKGKTLTLNAQIPRIVSRFEKSFESLGIAFNKTRVAKAFLLKMSGAEAQTVFPTTTQERFKLLLGQLNDVVAKLKVDNRGPFGT